ncbi:MAG: hypothetical protein J0M30_11670 [Chitinophagales bacterium]|nr:hypothetical protein [Chitinophagales bacterium]
MKKVIGLSWMLIIAALPLVCFSQVGSVKVRTLAPPNFPDSQKIYLAGSFNYWHTKDSLYQLRPEGGGWYGTEIPVFLNMGYEYKYSLGNWGRVELAMNDSAISNRRFYATTGLIISDTIEKFKAPSPPSQPSPQMVKINAMKDSTMGKLAPGLEKMKLVFRDYLINMVQDKPSKRVRRNLDKECIGFLENGYRKLTSLLWDIFAMLTPEQKAEIRNKIAAAGPDADLINGISGMLEQATGKK